MLPTTVPFDGSLFADILSSSSTSYVVEVAQAASCAGLGACHLATIAGYTSGSAPPLTGTAMTLNNGTTAYLNATQCGAGCTDSYLLFTINGYVYEVGAKGGNVTAALSMANSLQGY